MIEEISTLSIVYLLVYLLKYGFVWIGIGYLLRELLSVMVTFSYLAILWVMDTQNENCDADEEESEGKTFEKLTEFLTTKRQKFSIRQAIKQALLGIFLFIWKLFAKYILQLNIFKSAAQTRQLYYEVKELLDEFTVREDALKRLAVFLDKSTNGVSLLDKPSAYIIKGLILVFVIRIKWDDRIEVLAKLNVLRRVIKAKKTRFQKERKRLIALKGKHRRKAWLSDEEYLVEQKIEAYQSEMREIQQRQIALNTCYEQDKVLFGAQRLMLSMMAEKNIVVLSQQNAIKVKAFSKMVSKITREIAKVDALLKTASRYTEGYQTLCDQDDEAKQILYENYRKKDELEKKKNLFAKSSESRKVNNQLQRIAVDIERCERKRKKINQRAANLISCLEELSYGAQF